MFPVEAFKIGMLDRWLSDGVTAEELPGRVKEAGEKMAIFGELVNAAMSVGHGAIGYGVPLAIAGPPIAGALAGYGLARGTDIDDSDVEEQKKKEVIDTYRRYTGQLQRQKALRDYQSAISSTRAGHRNRP